MDRSVKLLLTLLVLLGGLSVAPAQARPCPAARVEQIEAARTAAATVANALARQVGAVAERSPARRILESAWAAGAFVPFPTIQYGDQALE